MVLYRHDPSRSVPTHEPHPRYRTGSRARRLERRAAVPTAAARGGARAWRHRARLQRHQLRVPREPVVARAPVRARGRLIPARAQASGGRHVAAGGAGARPAGHGLRRAAVRRLAGRRPLHELARPHRRRRLRPARLRRRLGNPAPHPQPARPLGRRVPHRLRGPRLAGARGPRHPDPAVRIPGPGRIRASPHCRAARPGSEVRGPSHPSVVAGPKKKLVLAVIDSLKPEMLDRAMAEGRAPALKAVVERGTYVRDCVSSYPSVTPVASSSIATGFGPDKHNIPSMNWFHRGESRYVEYGSSFQATRAFGIRRSLYDTVYNMNMAHLSRATKTVYEQLEDAGLRTACTTFLIYRGRTRHRLAEDGVYPAIARAAQFTHAVYGPTELFYADIFQSRRTGCTSMLGRPGQRDQHTGCVGAYLVENDLFDFMLFSLPDNDTYSHKHGPYAQVQSIAGADRALERIMHVAGGPDAFLDEHAVIVMSDHSQTNVEDRINLAQALGDWRVLAPSGRAEDAELAVSPAARSAMVYVLDPAQREELAPKVARSLQAVEGLDLIVRRDGDEAIVWSERGELRFAPGGELQDARGGNWS